MKDTITITKDEFLKKFAEASANFASEHPEIGVTFVMTSALICHEVTHALFDEEDT